MSGPVNAQAIVLAAGLSERMGAANKLLLRLDGEPLVRRVVSAYLACCHPVSVVTGHEADPVRRALDGLPVRFVHNPDYGDGQPTSVRAGLASIAPTGEAVLIGLGDQPLLEADDLKALLSAFAEGDRDKILIPYHGADRGNPVLLPAAIAGRLRTDDGNPGCRRFIDSHPELTRRYEAANAHFTTDIDTPDDAARWGAAQGAG